MSERLSDPRATNRNVRTYGQRELREVRENREIRMEFLTVEDGKTVDSLRSSLE